ncbi:trypsin-like serine peptidase [Streptomyces sp. NPDC059447]|uniref:trypsin-like serine peptidase n=1 Tax=Streptomyces sp. NPDC059447 TaxID=3346834 RepID=UPI0036B30DBA
MDYTQIFADPELKDEFLDRFEEIRDAAAGTAGLESVGALDAVLDVDHAADAVKQMSEGTWQGDDSGVEAIILQFGRPVHLIRGGTFDTSADAPDGYPESEVIAARLRAARPRLERVIPSVGRVDLRNHREPWAGTGWMVAEGIAVTNRHVARAFAERKGGRFPFRTISGRNVRADIDWRREYRRPQESRFRVTEVIWIAPDATHEDVALLRVAPTGEDGEPLPAPIPLATGERDGLSVGRWVGVIGYPGRGKADPDDRQRIFDGIYDHKRLAAGRLTAIERDRWVFHDATTLAGNSGSAVVDLTTGRALALHFAGWPGERNGAVRATDVARILREHAS